LQKELYEYERKTLGDSDPKTVHTHDNLIFFMAHAGHASEALQRIDKLLARLDKKHPKYKALKETRLWLAREVAKLKLLNASARLGKGGPRRLH
jgi:hypothetical protein